MIQCWRLDDGRQTLVLGADRDRLAEVVYWGARLPDDEDLTTLYQAHALNMTGGMLDANPELSICPEATRTFPGQPGLILRAGDGTPLLPKFCFAQADVGADQLTLTYTDEANGLIYRPHFSINARTHIIEARSVLEAEQPAHLHWLSAPVFPASQQSEEMIDVSGRCCDELQLNRTPWAPGTRFRENRTGRTGHEHFPGLIVPCRGATNTRGPAYAFHYGWSGGHRMVAEELPDGRRQVQFSHAARMESAPKQRFETAPIYVVFSDDGINGCAVTFQRHLRDEIVTLPKPDRPRPVHYNC